MTQAASYFLLPAQRYMLKGGLEYVEIVDRYNEDKPIMCFAHNNPDFYGTAIVFLKNELNREFEEYTKEIKDFCGIKPYDSIWA